ncbi:MAG: tetratricopeptide repeat protein [Bacillota bacterium]
MEQNPEPSFDEERLRQTVAARLKEKGLRVEPGRPGLYPLALGRVPEGYTRLWAAVVDMKLFLVAVNDLGEATLLTQIDDVMVHPVQVQIASTTDRITVQSVNQLGDTMVVELGWDGKSLTRRSSQAENPAAEYFAKRQALIDARDMDGLMALGGVKDLVYPQGNPGYWSQPRQILLLAYATSLERYRAGDPALALKTLQYGVSQYNAVYGGLLEPTQPGMGQPVENLIPVAERIPIANDLAFFLAENGRPAEALPILQQVVALAPDRAVAYLNLADVAWELGRKEEAKVHYQRYLDLLGADGAKAPERVRQRIDR